MRLAKSTLWGAASGVIGALMWHGPAMAQQTAAVPAAAGQLEEVVVTAEKRSEDIKEVPTSISVLGGGNLQTDHIQSYEDITRAVPGVSFLSGGGPGLDNIEIRGISSTSGSATVGIYLDEVPLTVKNLFNGAIEPKLFDIDRVEILRGPQGTLYGASSMGGTIRMISKLPDLNEVSGWASSDLSGTVHGGVNYEESGVINVPLAPGIAALRLGVDYSDESGYIDNYTPEGKFNQGGVDEERTGVIRASLLVKPSDGLTITPALYFERQVSDDTSVYYPTLGLYEQNKIVPERSRDLLFVPSVTVNQDLGWADLTSVSSYFWQQFNRTEDGTFYNSEYLGYLVDTDPVLGVKGVGSQVGALPGPEYSRNTTTQVSQEIRLASKPADPDGWPISWLGGVYYSDQQIHRSDDAYVLGLRDTFASLFGYPIQDSGLFSGYTFPRDSVDFSATRTEDRQFAAFGQLGYNITPDFKATAELRYAYARSAYTSYNQGYFAGNGPPVFGTNARYYAATPRFTATYDASPDVTFYTEAAKGFRLGGASYYVPTTVCGADLATLGLTSAPTSYGSDKLWSYEAGAKTRLLDDRLTVDGALYYITWDKIQETIALPTCGYTVTTNVGDAESYGAELEIAGKPLPNWTVTLAGGFTHATLVSVTSSVGAAVGDKILNTPDWTMTLGSEYDQDFGDDIDGFIRADYDWTGRSHGAFSPSDPDYSRPIYGVLNASMGVDVGSWRVSLYAKNILDNTEAIQHPSLLFLPEAYTLRPPTIGLLATKQF